MVSRSARVFKSSSLLLATLIVLFALPLMAAIPPATFLTAPAPYTVGTGPFYVVAAPLRTGSAVKDLVVSNSDVNGKGNPGNTISVLLNNGSGVYTQAPGSPITVGATATSGPIGIAVGDFNGDGKPDIAVTLAGENAVQILLGNGAGTFVAQTPFAVGANPLGIYATDLNGDKIPDLVVTNSGLFNNVTPCAGSSISILLGNGSGGKGNGTFSPAAGSPLSSAQCPAGAAIVDLGNGNLDLIVANDVGGTNTTTVGSVSVFVGNGGGTFKARTDYTVDVSPIFVAVGDFGNGKQDVAVANAGDVQNGGANSGGISILTGNGDGTLQPSTLIPEPGGAFFVGAADVNADGKTDLAFTSHSNGLNILFGNGNGTFQAPVIYSIPGREGALAIQDLNGDNKLDIVQPDGKGNTVSVLLNSGNGAFPAPRAYVAGNNPQALAVGSLRSGNARLDLVTSNGNFSNGGSNNVAGPVVSLLLGNGDGTFTPGGGINPPSPTSSSSVAIADFNGDGKADIAETENNSSNTGALRLVPGNGDGTFGAPVRFFPNPSQNPGALAAADFNGDTKQDLVVTNLLAPAGVTLNAGTPGQPIAGSPNPSPFTSINAYANNVGFPKYVTAAKLDGNSTKPDLVLAENNQFCGTSCTQNDAVAVLPNNGSGAFTQEFDLTAGKFPYAVAAGRFKNSSTQGLDIAVVNQGDNTVSIFLNNGDTTGTVSPFSGTPDHSYATGTIGISPQGIAVGDFNGDGNADLVIANTGPNNCAPPCAPGTISVLLGNGDGTFNAATEYTVLGAPSGVVVGDFNGDGFPDIAFTDQNGTLVTILLNTSGSVVSLGSSLNPSNYGDSVTFTATVTPRVGNGTPTGTVTFKDNGGASPASTNVPMASGKATFTTNLLPGGSHSIIAIYSGDASFAPGASSPLQQVVNKVASATSLTSSANPAAPGQAVKFSATVTPSAGVGAKGTVNFFDGATLIGSGLLNASEVATFTDSGLAIGSHSITAVYVGDGNFIGSTSSVLTQVIQPAATNTNLVSSANPSPQGQNVTFTATVSSGSGTPNIGNVVFTVDGVSGSPIAVSAGVAAFTTNTLTIGAHTVSAAYSGGGSFAASTSNTVTQLITSSGVTPSATAITQTAATPFRPGKPLPGEGKVLRLEQTLSVTITVTGNGVTAPTGPVILQDNGATVGSQTLTASGANGVAVIAVHGFSIGPHSYTAIYFGDNTYAGSGPSAAVSFEATPKVR